MEFAGKDISSWFDPETEDVRKFMRTSIHLEAAIGTDPTSPHKLSSGPQVCGSSDPVHEVLHPERPLCSRAPRWTSLRLGHRLWRAMVEGRTLQGGTTLGQNQVDPSHQHLDVTRAATGGEPSRTHQNELQSRNIRIVVNVDKSPIYVCTVLKFCPNMHLGNGHLTS